jgi:hypothetical protein
MPDSHKLFVLNDTSDGGEMQSVEISAMDDRDVALTVYRNGKEVVCVIVPAFGLLRGLLDIVQHN